MVSDAGSCLPLVSISKVGSFQGLTNHLYLSRIDPRWVRSGPVDEGAALLTVAVTISKVVLISFEGSSGSGSRS
jgi:hypothetical protein